MLRVMQRERDWKRRVTAGLLVLLGAACDPQEAEECFASTPDNPETLPTRELEIGDVSLRKFMPWGDGVQVEVELGSQGFDMITPYVEIPIEPGDADVECWCIIEGFVDPDAPFEWQDGFCRALTFEQIGDRMRMGPIFSILDAQPRGEPLLYEIRVASENFTASKSIEIILQ